MGAEERGIEALSALTVIAKRQKTNPFGYCQNKTFSDTLVTNIFLATQPDQLAHEVKT